MMAIVESPGWVAKSHYASNKNIEAFLVVFFPLMIALLVITALVSFIIISLLHLWRYTLWGSSLARSWARLCARHDITDGSPFLNIIYHAADCFLISSNSCRDYERNSCSHWEFVAHLFAAFLHWLEVIVEEVNVEASLDHSGNCLCPAEEVFIVVAVDPKWKKNR